LYHLRDHIPCRARIAGLFGILCIIVAVAGPHVFMIFAPLPLAYLLLWSGASMPLRIGTRNDLSYGMYVYGYPMQQLLVVAGVASALPAALFVLVSAISTALPAWASWLLVERPVMRLRGFVATHHSSGVIPETVVHEPS
jgi:peptidoglycan/LPS O-acetylase OafA/YrhL